MISYILIGMYLIGDHVLNLRNNKIGVITDATYKDNTTHYSVTHDMVNNFEQHDSLTEDELVYQA